jgi:hypothetical protein
MKARIVTLVLIVIIILLVFVVFSWFTGIGSNIIKNIPIIGDLIPERESFVTLRDPFLRETYDNTVRTLIDDGVRMIGRHRVLDVPSEQNMKMSLKAKTDKYYDDNIEDPNKLIGGFGAFLAGEFKEEAKKIGESSPEVLSYFDNVTAVKAGHYLTYLDQRFSYLDAVGGMKTTKPINVGEPIQTRFKNVGAGSFKKVFPVRDYDPNPLNKEINKDHNGSGKRRLLGYNANDLIVGIKRHGFSAGLKRRNGHDIRGLPRATIKKLVGLASSKDPNSLVRSAYWDPYEVLVSGRGFSNERLYKQAYEEYSSKSGRPEHNTFKYIKGRIVDPATTVERQITSNINEGIKSSLKHSVYD